MRSTPEAPSKTEPPRTSPAGLWEWLRRSEIFSLYQNAFQQATGLPLWLAAPDEDESQQDSADANALENAFCAQIGSIKPRCQSCVETQGLLQAIPGQEASTVNCFAGFRETAVPIWLGKNLVGYLRTGKVLAKPPAEEEFASAIAILEAEGDFRPRNLKDLHQAYFSSQVVDDERYGGVVQLLRFFATQLSVELERQHRQPTEAMPATVRKASRHLVANFDREVRLDEVARVAGISPHHLCTVFKGSTGLTLTEYHNRERILQAKRRLTNRYARISEVALDVGFGSLSQFNRCFQKFAGESPTEFRRRALGRQGEPHR
ncbi:MAG: helix-turn-helix domain-containing protein [Verrucomicrobiales bacterium]|nr:helix-turn-helix domain-containing protein [Verrucomicrobiales bacterium]